MSVPVAARSKAYVCSLSPAEIVGSIMGNTDFEDSYTYTKAYHRALNLDNRIRYVNEVILATAWYTTQIFPLPSNSVRQMNTAIQWFIWKGAIFKVPLSTLQLPKEAGGRALVHIMAKCMTLFILRMKKQGQQKATFTTDWLTRWHLHERTPNPPQIKRIPAKFDYLYRYNI